MLELFVRVIFIAIYNINHKLFMYFISSACSANRTKMTVERVEKMKKEVYQSSECFWEGDMGEVGWAFCQPTEYIGGGCYG